MILISKREWLEPLIMRDIWMILDQLLSVANGVVWRCGSKRKGEASGVYDESTVRTFRNTLGLGFGIVVGSFGERVWGTQ